MSEECLHLSVSTPFRQVSQIEIPLTSCVQVWRSQLQAVFRPDGNARPRLPVMFFVHGGAFYGGTQIRMGAERLGAWDDVVVVAINYRVSFFFFFLSLFLSLARWDPLDSCAWTLTRPLETWGCSTKVLRSRRKWWRHNFPLFSSHCSGVGQ